MTSDFSLPCVSFVNVYQFVCVCAFFPFVFEDGMWALILYQFLIIAYLVYL